MTTIEILEKSIENLHSTDWCAVNSIEFVIEDSFLLTIAITTRQLGYQGAEFAACLEAVNDYTMATYEQPIGVFANEALRILEEAHRSLTIVS